MAEDGDAELSDFEDEELEEPAPVELPSNVSSGTVVAGGGDKDKDRAIGALEASLRAALAELEVERQARKTLEVAKAEGDANFVRLKALIQEAARQRDEAYHQRDETARQLEEVVQRKEEAVRQRDEFGRGRDAAKAEIGEVARLLIGANDKVSSMVNGTVKSFGRSLPTSKYNGLSAIAFGFGKRMEEILEEVLKQRDLAVKTQLEVREQMEQRNYTIAIEVSKLEASVMQLKEEVTKKSSEAELWQKRATLKDDQFLDLEQEWSKKFAAAEGESLSLQEKLEEADSKFQSLKSELVQHKELFQEQLKYIGKLRKYLLDLPHDATPASDSEDPLISTSAVSNGNGDVKRNLPHECVARLKSLVELSATIGSSWKQYKEESETVTQEHVSRIERLVGQKQDAADLLAAALAEKQQVLGTISDLRVDLSQQHSEVERLQSSLKDAQELAELDKEVEEENEELVRIRAELSLVAQTRDEALSKTSALETEITNLRQQIGELEKVLAKSRSEVGEMKSLASTQAKELGDKSAQIRELMLRVEHFQADIEALEEEVERWKQAATEEAAAGAAVFEDVERCQDEIAGLNQQITQLKSTGEEVLAKLRSKEEMAAAATAARTAAERSLQMADERAAELRERLEELTKQLEDADRTREYRGPIGMGLFDMCWPRLRNLGRPSGSGGTQLAAEMEELLEPLV